MKTQFSLIGYVKQPLFFVTNRKLESKGFDEKMRLNPYNGNSLAIVFVHTYSNVIKNNKINERK